MDIETSWAIMCGATQSHAFLMEQDCSTQFAELILKETKELIGQMLPKTDAELSVRSGQSTATTSKIGTICHASRIAGDCSPEFAELILEEMRELCEQTLPKSDAQVSLRSRQNSAATSKISVICHADSIASACSAECAKLILEEAKKCCCGLPVTDADFQALHQRIVEITLNISNLRSDDMARR